MHTTNYFDSFILVSEDTKVSCGTKPPLRANKATVATLQYDLLVNNPYLYTSDELLFKVFAERNNISQETYPQMKSDFFSKGRACLRASPLPKTYGFGIHANSQGKLAIFAMESQQYERLLNDPKIKKLRAMRNSRAR
ncbi:hypothetical protein I215_11724 [Galbibacter marinus]|uniref:Uncharacterized protein n=1 Tax=Galbibacter marinus TaxID=555500 RepID=K2Q167_9FLAO|nr:DUF6157 family protein [Galbibacter marinus]EKF54626.1 hypothetical protein I215_11724 [Galbibacter marinus]